MPVNRVAILHLLVTCKPAAADQMFVAAGPALTDYSLRALINAVLADKPEDIATAARFYATTACQNDSEAYGLCMRLAAAASV
jgi:hypothetical protein